jgi:hypothetical protein
MKYFVMLVSGDNTPLPLVDSEADIWGHRIKLFDTEAEADSAGSQNLLGRAYGYEVMEWCWMEED